MGRFPILHGMVLFITIMGGIALGVGVLMLMAGLASIGQNTSGPGNLGAWMGVGSAFGVIAGGVSAILTGEFIRLALAIHHELERTANATEALAATIKKPTG